MKVLDIAEVAERSGVPPSTLRYYEEIGLISSIGRHGLRRQFGAETLVQLSLVTLAKSAGFSLDEISGMFDRDGVPALSQPDLFARADTLQAQAEKLAALADLLRHVARCKAPSHMECPTFRRLLGEATRERRARRR